MILERRYERYSAWCRLLGEESISRGEYMSLVEKLHTCTSCLYGNHHVCSSPDCYCATNYHNSRAAAPTLEAVQRAQAVLQLAGATATH